MTTKALQELKEQLLANDRIAYKKLLENCGHYCIQKLMHKTGCRFEDAEDMLMDAVLIFRKNLLDGKITNLSSIRAYIYSTCFNKWSEYRREQERNVKAIAGISNGIYRPEPNAEEKMVAAEDQQQQLQFYQRQIEISKAALHALGEKCQKILQYFYVEDKSMAEIADALGYSNAKVAKNLKARCYKKWIQIAHEKMEIHERK